MAPRADRIGSLLFCPTCGTLLNLPGEDDVNVKCEQCGHLEPSSCKSGFTYFRIVGCRLTGIVAYEGFEVETRSRPDAFPSVLQLKRTTQTKEHIDANVKTKTAETCPKCGHKEALSQERQLRSADEGSTIFLEVSLPTSHRNLITHLPQPVSQPRMSFRLAHQQLERPDRGLVVQGTSQIEFRRTRPHYRTMPQPPYRQACLPERIHRFRVVA
ncbi:transcription elongation factor S-II [Ceratobasidium sp. AG-Ba]|nr:transcription elongation factor S-II [Ceratobasidium sp. AG-Ba]QRV91719.1 transcription elongation factor S-II [Ceratobasidium sp. AG-Ba]